MQRLVGMVLVTVLGCGSVGKQIMADSAACAMEGVATAAQDILLDVEAILMNGSPLWREELDALKAQGTGIGVTALLCAVQRAWADLSSRGAVGAGEGSDVNRVQTGVENAQAYLAANKQPLGIQQ